MTKINLQAGLFRKALLLLLSFSIFYFFILLRSRALYFCDTSIICVDLRAGGDRYSMGQVFAFGAIISLVVTTTASLLLVMIGNRKT